MWNNFSRCPALISLCGNSSLVPNCGSRRTQPEHTAEQKGNNWSLPCPAHRFILTFIIMMCFTEGDCMISFRHFMSAAPWFEPSHYLPRLCTCFFPLFILSAIQNMIFTKLQTQRMVCESHVYNPSRQTASESCTPNWSSCHILNFDFAMRTLRVINTLVRNWSRLLFAHPEQL